MNIIKKGLIYFTAAIAAASLISSCQKDDTIQYNNGTMGNIVEGRFISDQGNIFNVVEQTCIGELYDMERAFVVCDVLRKTDGGKDNEYDVRLKQIATVMTKNVVYHENTTEEMLVQDPVYIEYVWIAGGYLNLHVIFPIKAGSTTGHLINLVHEGEMVDSETGDTIEGTYRFSLRHNANGDKITPPQTHDYVLGGGYVSFPLSSYISENEAKFCIEWEWHKSLGDGLSTETETIKLNTTYKTGGFQHAPKNAETRLVSIN